MTSSKAYDLDREWVTDDVDPAGNRTHADHDNLGRPTVVTLPDGTQTTTKYVDRLEAMPGGSVSGSGVAGWPHQKTVAVQQKDAYGVTVDARFDGSGRLVAVRKIAKNDSVTATDTGSVHVANLSYNIFDKLEWSRDPDGRESYNDYDGTGRLTASRVLQTPQANGLSTKWEKTFTYQDNVSTYIEADEKGVQTTFQYNKYDQDTLITRDSGMVGGTAGKISVHYSYDNLGNLVRLTDPKGLVESRVYNGLNQATQVLYPDDLERDIIQDLSGKVIQTKMAGRAHPDSMDLLNLSYDGLGRVLSESYGVNLRDNETYVYDGISSLVGESYSYPGQLLALQRGTGLTTLFRYDSLQHLKRRRAVSAALGYDVTQAYRYDAAGSVASMDLPQGRETSVPRLSYGYDPFHRLSGIAFVAGTDSLPVVRNVAYRQNDLISSFGLGGHLAIAHGYETQRPMLTSLIAKADTATIYRQSYLHDEVGSIVGMRRFSGDSVGYDYDKLYQLRNVRYPQGNTDNRPANLAFTYDANGNRTSFGHDFTSKSKPEWLAYQPGTGTTVGSNRLSVGWSGREGYTGYGYDYRGNLRSERSFADSTSMIAGTNAWKERVRKFNSRGELERLTSTIRQVGGDSTIWAYDYDQTSNRIEKRSAPISAVGNGDTTWRVIRKYAYDGVSVVADSSVGDLGWTYSVMLGLRRVAQIKRDAQGRLTTQYIVPDHLGTANLIADSLGKVLQTNVFDPWGNVELSLGTVATNYPYMSKEWDAEIGGYYFGARRYLPSLGIWDARDPKESSFSQYVPFANNAMKFIDPDANANYGSASKLSEVSISVMGRSDLKPSNGYTYCNFGAEAIVNAAGTQFAIKDGISGTANDIYSQLSNSLLAQSVSADKAVELAKLGITVIAAYQDPSGGHGHVAVVAPDVDPRGRPMVFNIGAENKEEGISWAFSSEKRNSQTFGYFVLNKDLPQSSLAKPSNADVSQAPTISTSFWGDFFGKLMNFSSATGPEASR